MGASPQSQLVAISTKAGSMLQGNEQSCSANGSSLWGKIMVAQAKRSRWQGIIRKQRIIPRRHIGGHVKGKRQPTGISMKKMACSGSRKLHANGIGRKVRTLKKLVPNGESMGLDGLFRETADYILSLQMKVRVMQTMVDVLTNSDE